MRVRLSVDVDDLDRYLIARHFRTAEGGKPRTRATRAQVRRFLIVALNTVLGDQAQAARGRAKGVVRRLKAGPLAIQFASKETLPPSDDGRQPTLW